MKNIILSTLAFLVINIGYAQGIKFEKNLSWEEARAKAKIEHKFIFLDCFATWCGPCKQMDKTVYMDNKIGVFMNAHFISLKVQFDSTIKDDADVRAWYAEANSIFKHYNITAFPTYLFFSAEGKLLHRELGFKPIDEFLALGNNALDTAKQYYTLLDNFRKRQITFGDMPYLIKQLAKVKDKYSSEEVANYYIDNYLLKQPDSVLFEKANLDLIATNVRSTRSKAFDLFYHNAEKVDAILGRKKFSQAVVDYVITREEIDLKLADRHKNRIDDKVSIKEWKHVYKNIRKKYNQDFADRVVLDAKIRYYGYYKQWPELIQCKVQKIDRYGLDTTGIGWLLANNVCFEIFQHSDNKVFLNKALRWMEVINEGHPEDEGDWDTYANLQYKIGHRSEAIKYERLAIQLVERKKNTAETKKLLSQIKSCVDEIAEFNNNIAKMDQGKATWLAENKASKK